MIPDYVQLPYAHTCKIVSKLIRKDKRPQFNDKEGV